VAEITIITAFFDIGREKWTGFERDNSKYVKFFKFWARMKNKVVVYTDSRTAQQVMEIRDSFGLKDRTHVICIDEVTSVAPDVYQAIEYVLTNETAVKFRRKPTYPESCNPLYNYVMYLKSHLITDAIQRGLADDMIAWMDFGYNHGGAFYTNPQEFDFLWTYDFSPKIHVFAVEPLDNTPVFEIVRSMNIYFAGGIIVAPAFLWIKLLDLVRNALFSLASCGLADDDQTLLIMAYRAEPDLFEIHPIEDFFCPLRDCGASHLTFQFRQSKRTRLVARKLLKQGQYWQAIQGYFKYGVEKLQSK
jgi:protein YibB